MPDATVLVIEDNSDILDAIRLLLEHEGFKVITAQNGLTAYDFLTLYQPDIILTDLMMPEMTGLELIHRIRRVANFDRIPIIAMSAFDRTYLAAAIGAGAITALHKPEDLDILPRTIRDLIEKGMPRDAAGMSP